MTRRCTVCETAIGHNGLDRCASCQHAFEAGRLHGLEIGETQAMNAVQGFARLRGLKVRGTLLKHLLASLEAAARRQEQVRLKALVQSLYEQAGTRDCACLKRLLEALEGNP